MDGLVRFYVNNSPVSVSGTTSAAGLPYQIAFARPSAGARAPAHFFDQQHASAPSEAVGGRHAPHFGQNPVYDSSLNDLIDARYYQHQPHSHLQSHLYSNTSPLSDISTALGDEEDEDDEESADSSTEAVSDQGAYFPTSIGPGDFGDRAGVYGAAMAPTAIVDVRAADSSNLLDLDSSTRNGRLSHRHSTQSFDGSCSKSARHKPRKFKNPHLAQQQRRQANMRERRRMKSINHAFEGLRQKIPTLPYEKKLSKVDTLKLAINYIQFLQELIDTDDGRKMNGGGEDGAGSAENGGVVDDQNRSNGRAQRSRTASSNAPPAKKIIVECRTAFPYADDESADVPPLRGHSLSWSRVGERNAHSFMTAKLWRPQQQLPQQPSGQASSAMVEAGEKAAPSPSSSTSNSLWYETEKFSLASSL